MSDNLLAKPSLHRRATTKSEESYVICVCGPSCSGKTTVCGELEKQCMEMFGNTPGVVCVLSQDRYYVGAKKGDDPELVKLRNYDEPAALEFSLMRDHLIKLINGESANVPCYDFASHSRLPQTVNIGPAIVIIVEGILLFTQQEILDLCDTKVFIDTDSVICYQRRLERDVLERGRTMKEVAERYREHVVPSYAAYIKPNMRKADIIIPNDVDGSFIGLDILLDHTEKWLNILKK